MLMGISYIWRTRLLDSEIIKLIEESPVMRSPALRKMGEAAVQACKDCGYVERRDN